MQVINYEKEKEDVIVEKVAALILEEKLVILPTDTVYGVMALATSKKAINDLYKAKKREKSKPTALLVDSIETAQNTINEQAMDKLAKSFWPGALTIVADAKINICNWPKLGVRIPDDSFLLKIIKRVSSPVIASSANITGAQAPTSINEISVEIAAYVEVAIDKGETKEGEASTIIEIKDNNFKILRSGPISEKQISDVLQAPSPAVPAGRQESSTPNSRVLFICLGNTCRSPMAEAIFNKIAQEKGLDIRAESAGIMAYSGSSAATNAKLVMQDKDIDLGNHRSQYIEDIDLDKFDLILTMEHSQLGAIPEPYKNKAHQLSEYASGEDKDITDPIGGDLETYKTCADTIEKYIDALVDKTSKY